MNAALEEYVRFRKQLSILEMFEKVEYVEGYNYKQGRKNHERSS